MVRSAHTCRPKAAVDEIRCRYTGSQLAREPIHTGRILGEIRHAEILQGVGVGSVNHQYGPQ